MLTETNHEITTDHQREVCQRLTGMGISAHVQWPGVVTIFLRNGYSVNTGMHGWDYGSWERHGVPVEDDSIGRFEPHDLPEDCQDPVRIARRWAACIFECESAVMG